MRIYWIWLIFSIGGILDLMLIAWNFPRKRGRKFLEAFYGIMIPLTAGWKIHLVFQERSADILLLLLMALLILGTWKITGEKPGAVLTAFAFLYIGGIGSELLAIGIVKSVFGLSVLPLIEAKGTMLCIMTTNVFMLFYLMLGNWLWKQYGQGKHVSRDFLLFFLVLAQTLFLFWIVYNGYQGIVKIKLHLLIGAGIIVFGTMSFSYIQIHAEETKERERKLKKIEIQTQKEYEKYCELKEMEKILHQIRHDFNNQLATVYYLLKENQTKQAEKLLEEMEEALRAQPSEIKIEKSSAEAEIGDFIGEKPVLGIPGEQILLLPLGKILLFPAICQILNVHWGSRAFLLDLGIFGFTAAADGFWMFLLFCQYKREKTNERLFHDIFRQQMEQYRENAVWEGVQEKEVLREELLFCLSQAKKAVKVSRELSVVQGYLFREQKKENIRYCENELVHTVLEEKQKNCRNFHISFSVQTEVPERLDIKGSHLCSIFTNLLDNGINACKSLPEDRRWMSVQSKIQGDYLYIRTANSTNQDYRKQPSLPGHGLGKQILARLAAEYQGEYWTEEDEKTYVAVVVLQIYQKPKITSN